MTLDYSDVLGMKRAVDEVYHLNVHFHDSCGGQYFSFDEIPSDSLKKFIADYFEKNGIKVNYSDDSLSFTLEKR